MYFFKRLRKFTLLLLFSCLTFSIFPEGQQVSEKIYSVRPDTLLDVVNYNGSVHISRWNRDDIVVTAKKVSWAWQGRDDIQQVRVVVSESSSGNISRTKIETKYSIAVERVFVYLEVKVPYSIKINNIICNNGGVIISELSGDMNIKVTNGAIALYGIKGNLTASTNNGDITADRITGNMKLSSSTGRINVTSLSGNISADLINGRINFDNIHGNTDVSINRGDFTQSNTRGSSKIRIVNGSIDVREHNGSGTFYISQGQIRLRSINGIVEAAAENGSINARSVDGIIRCQTINGSISVEVNRIPESGSILTTENGDVTLRALNPINTAFEIFNPRGNIRVPGSAKIISNTQERMTGIIGSGQAKLFISTKNGSVRIRD